MALHPGEMVDAARRRPWSAPCPPVELVTVGQRRGLGVAVDGRRRYALAVDVRDRRITVGAGRYCVLGACPGGGARRGSTGPCHTGARALAQTSAHGAAAPCTWDGDAWSSTSRSPLVAPGQTVALYDADDADAVVGAASAAAAA